MDLKEKIECPVCGSSKSKRMDIRTQEKEKKEMIAERCEGCKAIYLEDYKIDRLHIYKDEDYSPWGKREETGEKVVADSKKEAFRHQLSLLKRYINPKDKRLLDVGTGKGYLLEVAKEMGFEVYGVEPSSYCSRVAAEKLGERIFCGRLEDSKYKDEMFDVITMTDIIEHIFSPHSFLEEIYRILKDLGFILITTPNSDSFTRKLLGKDWFQYKYEHVIYYNKKSLSYLLEKRGFSILKIKNNVKRFKVGYYYHYLKTYSLFGIERFSSFVFPYLPNFIKEFSFPNPFMGEMVIVGKKRNKNIEKEVF